MLMLLILNRPKGPKALISPDVFFSTPTVLNGPKCALKASWSMMLPWCSDSELVSILWYHMRTQRSSCFSAAIVPAWRELKGK